MQKQLQAPNILEREDLKTLGSATGPCVSLYFADHGPGEKTRQDSVRLRNAIAEAERQLSGLGFDKKAVAELLDPVQALDDDLTTWQGEGNAFAILRSPDFLKVYRPMSEVPETSVVAEHFYVLPLVRMLDIDRHFFVLALSQKHIRLLRCTRFSSEEVALPEGTPLDLEEWLNTRMPNASPDRSGQEPPEPGSTLGSFNSSTDRDRKVEHLANFFRMIDKAVLEVLRQETAPLILAGVEHQTNMYVKITGYQHVAEQTVTGSPDSVKGGELHQRALAAAEVYWRIPLEKALKQHEDAGGSERRVTGVLATVRAAYEGRIAHLFIADGVRAMGTFNPDRLEAKLNGHGDKSAEDLANLAALQTLAHGGEVWVLPADQVPGNAQIAAVCRY